MKTTRGRREGPSQLAINPHYAQNPSMERRGQCRIIDRGISNMLWELLVAIGSVMFVVSAVQSARHANTGPGGFALVVAVGLIFAVVYEWAAHKFADALDDRKIVGRSQRKGGACGVCTAGQCCFCRSPLYLARM
jgi:hypothetical protein